MSPVVVAELRELGLDTEWTGANDPGDPAVLARAYAENRVLITLDKDFGELAVLHGHAHFGIVRLVDIPPTDHTHTCMETIERYGGALEVGAIVTVEKDRTRVRVEDEDDDEDA
jgi:predicted nuclease of predicted toxin-antitoxin system